MILFLTSSPCDDNVPEGIHIPCILNEVNDFVCHIRENWKPLSRGLIISAAPDNYDLNDEMADSFEKAFGYHGLSMASMTICDNRNAAEIAGLMAASDMLILAGGHVPTQNAFFRRIGLRELIKDYAGIVMGISAGTMNCAEVVYAQPEEPGESIDPNYHRFIRGLGLTEVMVLPHYQMVRNNMLDGRRLYEDITYGDSMGQQFYVLVDGSYILVKDGITTLYGEGYLIADGRLTKLCEKGEQYRIER